ncbi:MAG: hypothetical protein H8Z69_04445 [Nanohaloarchaea archaeon]|nr:hypothetical protein [Candidatus Nanohaloarchaea archaeon]
MTNDWTEFRRSPKYEKEMEITPEGIAPENVIAALKIRRQDEVSDEVNRKARVRISDEEGLNPQETWETGVTYALMGEDLPQQYRQETALRSTRGAVEALSLADRTKKYLSNLEDDLLNEGMFLAAENDMEEFWGSEHAPILAMDREESDYDRLDPRALESLQDDVDQYAEGVYEKATEEGLL